MDFARQVGVSQGMLSQLESGQINLSHDHIKKLENAFRGPKYDLSFIDFEKEAEQEYVERLSELTARQEQYVALRAWRWSGSFDIDAVPPSDGEAALVMVRSSGRPLAAVQLNRRSAHWEAGEILVFEHCQPDEVEEDDICLVKAKPPRAHRAKTMIALAHKTPAKRGPVLQFEPLSPASAVFTATDGTVSALLHAIFRCRYLK
jgi:transcriptional regulator with XRE-family HTH domain